MNKRYLLIVALGLAACSNHFSNKTVKEKNLQTSSNITTKHNDQLQTIYTQAIAEFIKAAYQNNKTVFDTLYFGKHVYGQAEDFPDIVLPATIENTQVRLLDPVVGQKRQMDFKSMVYVNLMAWVEKTQAEFLFVVFSNGATHQYDYTIRFKRNHVGDSLELDKITFENYLAHKGQKPPSLIIYQGGKYLLDK